MASEYSQELVDSANTRAIASNTASIIGITLAVQEEKRRAMAAESAILSSIDEAVAGGGVVDPKSTITATDRLLPASEQLTANAGNVYLLLSEQEGFIKNRMYRLEYDESDGSFSYSDVLIGGLPVGEVSHVKFSFAGGVLSMSWQDPSDVVQDGATVSKWAGTRIVCKAYPTPPVSDAAAYPKTPSDGASLAVSTVRNQYLNSPLTISGLDPDSVYFVAFFPYTDDGVYTPPSESGRFRTDGYSWETLLSHLENYPTESSFLPEAGGAFTVRYMVDDYYTDTTDGTTRSALSRSAVKEALANPDASWRDVESVWRVLGYNKSTPCYVKYRKANGDGTYDYKYVSSMRDSFSDVTFHLLDGTSVMRKVRLESLQLIGGLEMKDGIAVGDNVYSCTYDAESDRRIYSLEDSAVTLVDSSSTFTYGDCNTFTVPMRIGIDGVSYDFCGYTMTVQSQSVLNGANPSGLPSILPFDPREMASAPATNLYAEPAEEANDYGYYYRPDASTAVAIDVRGGGLGGQTVERYLNKTVFALSTPADAPFYRGEPIGTLAAETQFFLSGHRYANADGVEMTPGTDYAVGQIIPAGWLELNADANRVNYGCNIYAQSALRQYINSRLGPEDAWYSPQNRFEPDVKPTDGMMGLCNGLMLKFSKEPGFLRSIVPSMVPSRVTTFNMPYVRVSNADGLCWTSDCLFPLSYYEVALVVANSDVTSTVDSSSQYSSVYSNNYSRVKATLNADGESGVTRSWWSRTPNLSYSSTEQLVTTLGTASSVGAFRVEYYGCSPACVLG